MLEPSWSVLNPHSFYSRARRVRVEAEYTFWHELRPVADVDSDEDWTTLTTLLHKDTGLGKVPLTRHFDALDTLDQLPRLKALIRETFLLDLHHVGIIDSAVKTAPSALLHDDFFWTALDEDLMTRFTPSRPQQLLPGRKAITDTVLNTIRSVEELAAPAQPSPWGEQPAPEAGPVPCEDPAATMRALPPADDAAARLATLFTEPQPDGTIRFTLTVDQVTGTLISDVIAQAAHTRQTGQARAMADLLLEPATIQVNSLLYSAHDVDDSPVYHPTTGLLTEESAATLREMVTRTLDMDDAQQAETPAHDMTFRILCCVIGRDWVCRWPGCNAKASHLDGDHRINHADGGPTRADNIVMLCRHHHNRKTDLQATYLLDPVTGDVYWHFRDGTYAVDLATGPLAPRERRWVQTYTQRKARAREYAHRKAVAERFDAYQARHEEPERPPPPRPDPLSFLPWNETSPPADDPDPPPF